MQRIYTLLLYCYLLGVTAVLLDQTNFMTEIAVSQQLEPSGSQTMYG